MADAVRPSSAILAGPFGPAALPLAFALAPSSPLAPSRHAAPGLCHAMSAPSVWSRSWAGERRPGRSGRRAVPRRELAGHLRPDAP